MLRPPVDIFEDAQGIMVVADYPAYRRTASTSTATATT